MRPNWQEILSVGATVAVLFGLPVAIFAHAPAQGAGRRVIVLTGVGSQAVWTDEDVNASSLAVGARYRPATIRLREGESVLLRLRSADVTHGFYVPELGVGPVVVVPGHLEEVVLEGARAGRYEYYCDQVCGRCHYFMRGEIVVETAGGGQPPRRASALPHPCGQVRKGRSRRPVRGEVAQRGERLFHTKGCSTCHGDGGRGGVSNPNTIKGTVPALDRLADRMLLFEPEDAQVVERLLAEGADLPAKASDPPFPDYGRFLGQYRAVRHLIRNGNPAGRRDPHGPAPPLDMPSWRHALTDTEVRAILVYLLGQFPWEAE